VAAVVSTAAITGGLLYAAFDSGHRPALWVTVAVWGIAVVISVSMALWRNRRGARSSAAPGDHAA